MDGAATLTPSLANLGERVERRPGTGARIFLFFLSAAGSVLLLALGFPPSAPDRLPALAVALALALVAARGGRRGILLFSLLFPCAGGLGRLFGSVDPIAWPVLLFGGLAVGWCFHFIYDFESLPRSSRLDPLLQALLAVWALSTLVAVARAHTLWAIVQGLTGRVVNGEGLLEGAAIRDSVLALSALVAGAGYFFLLRRAGEDARRKAAEAALAGAGISALVSLLQYSGLLPAEAHPYWRLTGRLSGGAIDPNSLGLLCALALIFVLCGEGKKWVWRGLLVTLPLGLVLSGSRSGFLVALLSAVILLFRRTLSSRARLAAILAAIAIGALSFFRASPGSVGTRLAQVFDPELPVEYRASSRPALWQSALQLFLRYPFEGAGMGAYSWNLPDLLREDNRPPLRRDNPGNAYIQALAETGLIGFFLTLAFALSLARQAISRVRDSTEGSRDTAGGIALVTFLLALLLGSHWFAADVSLFFFLLCAGVALPRVGTPGRRGARARAIALAGYLVAAILAVLSTARPEETFRHANRIGFHRREAGRDGPFQWTRQNFALSLEPGETVRLRLGHLSPEGRPVSLEVKVAGRTVFRRELQPREYASLRLTGSSSDRRVFRFSLSRAFVPKHLGVSEDRRELGLVALLP